MPEPLSLREFGASVGITGEAIRKAIATGRIPPDCVGERQRGKKMVPCIIDPERARVALARNTDPTQRRDNAKIAASKTKHGRDAAKHLDRSTPPPPPEGGEGTDARGVPTIASSKAVAEAFKARLLKLEFDEKSGRLIPADTVKIEVAGMIATVRTRLLGVPVKAKQRLPHLTRDDVNEIEAMIREALEELADYGSNRGQ